MKNNQAANRLCITLDVDWACDEIIKSALELMQQSRVKATFFATHCSELLTELDQEQFEVGLHPNFNDAQGDFSSPIKSLTEAYPKAKGARSHSLFVSSHILQLYRDSGLRYESNIFLNGHEGLHPVLRFEDFASIPFCWSDDKHISLERPFELNELDLDSIGLKVLNFHPIHLFMNTSSDAHYGEYKQYYQEPIKLRNFVNREGPGIGTLFEAVLSYIENTERPTFTLDEICQQYLTRESLPI